MHSYSKLIDEIIEREGGYVDNPADRGGPTRWGITEQEARANGYSGDMRELPQSLARNIYQERFVVKPGFDKVAQRSEVIAAELIDTGVNMGPKTGAHMLQRALNVLNREQRTYPDITADGQIGPQTLSALFAFLNARGDEGERVLLRLLNAFQAVRYVEIAEHDPSQEVFVYGWISKRIS